MCFFFDFGDFCDFCDFGDFCDSDDLGASLVVISLFRRFGVDEGGLVISVI